MSLVRRFPAIHHVLAEAGATLLRFPLVLLSAVTASASAVYLVHIDRAAPASPIHRLLMAALLGIPLFFALATLSERARNRRTMVPLGRVIGVLLLGAYYLSLPAVFDRPDTQIVRFLLLAICLHALVAFVPFLRRGDLDGFWQFNRALFIRFLTAAVYSTVLSGGLAIALGAIDQLFGVKIDPEVYAQLFMVISGVFNTWFFLAGVPADLDALNAATDYPLGLKVFTQYILLPLVALYFVILIAYEAKILATWNWPKGWVSELVLWYSVVGILSLLLLFPLQKRAENRWIVAFGRWFFRGLIPLVVMLFLAIYQRIADYGITVPRYLVIGMAIGLAFVVLYFVFGKRRDIRVIPIVLCVLALLSTYGPQSAFSVSRASQSHRLAALMNKYEILADGRVHASSATIPVADRRQMSSIVDYLADLDGPQGFRGWFPDSVVAGWQDSSRTRGWRQEVTLAMGFEYAPSWGRWSNDNYFSFSFDRAGEHAVSIAGYDYLINLSSNPKGDSSLHAFPLDGDTCFVRTERERAAIVIGVGEARAPLSDSIRLELAGTILDLVQTNPTGDSDPGRLTFDAAGREFQVRVLIPNVNGTARDSTVQVDRIEMRILLRRTAPPG